VVPRAAFDAAQKCFAANEAGSIRSPYRLLGGAAKSAPQRLEFYEILGQVTTCPRAFVSRCILQTVQPPPRAILLQQPRKAEEQNLLDGACVRCGQGWPSLPKVGARTKNQFSGVRQIANLHQLYAFGSLVKARLYGLARLQTQRHCVRHT
jgi:hypothetical protein